jgi:hypothetical protein
MEQLNSTRLFALLFLLLLATEMGIYLYFTHAR